MYLNLSSCKIHPHVWSDSFNVVSRGWNRKCSLYTCATRRDVPFTKLHDVLFLLSSIFMCIFFLCTTSLINKPAYACSQLPANHSLRSETCKRSRRNVSLTQSSSKLHYCSVWGQIIHKIISLLRVDNYTVDVLDKITSSTSFQPWIFTILYNVNCNWSCFS